ncbi:MAG: enhanced serine sensitivity protein SseB C-terminal domain-containing protein [Pseudomonas sp.]|uniref:enhanced serine sensitivity protein SseB C-terminal domain-containing protein n=1 Tax=Pseudomonas sp. TaxID=306 RepID=UPI003394112D
MPSSPITPDQYTDASELGLAAVSHPPLERMLTALCRERAVRQAYLAAVQDPAQGPKPRLLLALAGADQAARQRLAEQVSDWLPAGLALDLIELADDSLSVAIRAQCVPFHRL